MHKELTVVVCFGRRGVRSWISIPASRLRHNESAPYTSTSPRRSHGYFCCGSPVIAHSAQCLLEYQPIIIHTAAPLRRSRRTRYHAVLLVVKSLTCCQFSRDSFRVAATPSRRSKARSLAQGLSLFKSTLGPVSRVISIVDANRTPSTHTQKAAIRLCRFGIFGLHGSRRYDRGCGTAERGEMGTR